MNRAQRSIEGKLKREYGASPQQREALDTFLNKCDDWYATCPKCGEKLRGTLDQLKAHKHGEPS